MSRSRRHQTTMPAPPTGLVHWRRLPPSPPGRWMMARGRQYCDLPQRVRRQELHLALRPPGLSFSVVDECPWHDIRESDLAFQSFAYHASAVAAPAQDPRSRAMLVRTAMRPAYFDHLRPNTKMSWPAATATYCLPSTAYVIGPDATSAPTLVFHRIAPVLASNA